MILGLNFILGGDFEDVILSCGGPVLHLRTLPFVQRIHCDLGENWIESMTISKYKLLKYLVHSLVYFCEAYKHRGLNLMNHT